MYLKKICQNYHLLFFLAISFSGCDEQREKLNDIESLTDDYLVEGKQVHVDGEPFTGVVFEEYSTGELKAELYLKKGIPNGRFASFYQNGNKWKMVNYRNGVPEGLYEAYHENGKLGMRGKYVNGKRDGYWVFYDDIGNLVSSDNFENGKMVN
jgi:antitoxin component YwqK of YwqJK toxin-antitoxin module